MKVVYLILVLSIIIATIYFVVKSINFRKFLAGAFFVSAGIQLYLAYANVSIPVLGTDILQTPELGFVRGFLHLFLCIFCFYFGFVRKQKNVE
jgi:hypothetical protein